MQLPSADTDTGESERKGVEMSNLISDLIQRAKKNPKRVAFPESDNRDILKLAEETYRQGIGFPVLLGNEEKIRQLAIENQISTDGFSFADYENENNREVLAENYCQKFQDMSKKSVMRKAKSPLNCAMFLLKLGMADAVAAGKDYSTGEVLIAAQTIVGMQEGVESVSSLGIADIPGFEGPQGSLLGLADCAITAQPDAKDLAGIAIASADTARILFGWEPRVAMLAFSTCGSAEHESIDVVRKGVEFVHELRPDIKCDGEFQLDSAIMPAIAAKKVKRESEVAGKANILVFPNLHAGNIGVKLVQIFGKANAYGPVLQGFALPVCDFSRSAPIEEMLGNVAMLVLRAGAREES